MIKLAIRTRIPPKINSIPDDKRFDPGTFATLEYTAPAPQERVATTIKAEARKSLSDVVLPVAEKIRYKMAPKPRNNPDTPLPFTLISFRKNHSIPIIHKGSAETSTAAIPEGTYC